MHNTYEAEVVGGILATQLIQTTPGTDFKRILLYIDNTRSKLTIQWISSHSDIKGNEHADKLSKEAAKGNASPQEQLPPMLRRTLLASASVVKQEHLAHLKRKWKSMWHKSPRHQRFTQINNIPKATRRTRTKPSQPTNPGTQRTHSSKLIPLQNRQIQDEAMQKMPRRTRRSNTNRNSQPLHI